MDTVIDSVRKQVSKWVNTTYNLLVDANVGDTQISIESTRRLERGDAIIFKNDNNQYVDDYFIIDILDRNKIVINKPIVAGSWLVSENAQVVKMIHNQYIQSIFFGDPDVIPGSSLPCVTVFGSDKSSEWMTIGSTRERYNLSIGIYSNSESHEDGYRYVTEMARNIEHGLKNNIFPLVGHYKTVNLIEDIKKGDKFIRISDTSHMKNGIRIIIEDNYVSTEAFVKAVIDPNTIELHLASCFDYDMNNSILIMPTRFIFNTWVSNIEYGTIHKGSLLQACKLSWFAEEEEIQNFIRMEPKLL